MRIADDRKPRWQPVPVHPSRWGFIINQLALQNKYDTAGKRFHSAKRNRDLHPEDFTRKFWGKCVSAEDASCRLHLLLWRLSVSSQQLMLNYSCTKDDYELSNEPASSTENDL